MSNLFATPTISELKINLLLRLLHVWKVVGLLFYIRIS